MTEYRWPYLMHPAFDIRYAIAANWLKDCMSVLEIGGWRLNSFLTDADITCVDPAAPIETSGSVKLIRGKIEEYRGEHDGICLLGLGFGGAPLAASAMQILQSQVAVVEIASDWGPSEGYFDRLLKMSKKKVELVVDIDLSANGIVSDYRVRAKRRIHLLR